jgi:hypothetical protein
MDDRIDVRPEISESIEVKDASAARLTRAVPERHG